LLILSRIGLSFRFDSRETRPWVRPEFFGAGQMTLSEVTCSFMAILEGGLCFDEFSE